MEKRLPDASDAEKWLDPDTFVAKGRVYCLELDFTIREIVSLPAVTWQAGEKCGSSCQSS